MVTWSHRFDEHPKLWFYSRVTLDVYQTQLQTQHQTHVLLPAKAAHPDP